jgi:hypothetical protein
MRDHISHGSSQGTDAHRRGLSGHKLSNFKPTRLGTDRAKDHSVLGTWSDEAELVTYVEGRSSPHTDDAQAGGIVITHSVTYTTERT